MKGTTQHTTYNQASSQYVHCMYYGLPGTAYRYDDHPTLVAIVYLILNFQLSHWDQRKKDWKCENQHHHTNLGIDRGCGVIYEYQVDCNKYQFKAIHL